MDPPRVSIAFYYQGDSAMNEKRQDFQELLDALGVKLGAGSGDYTEDRRQWLDKMTLEELFLAMLRAQEGDENHYEEIC